MELLKNNKRIFPLIGAIIVFILSFSVLYMGEISDFPITAISGEYCL